MLFEAYKELVRGFPNACQHLYGTKIHGTKGLWLCLDGNGYPHLLFDVVENEDLADLKLKAVEVRFSCPCDIDLISGTAYSGTYTLVSLGNDDPDIIRVFLRLIEEAFLVPGTDYNAAYVREKILEISDLFTEIKNDFKDVVGLWGELHTIRSAPDADAAVRA